MNDLVQTQAECYRLLKQNQEMMAVIQEVMTRLEASSLEEVFTKLPEKKVNDSTVS